MVDLDSYFCPVRVHFIHKCRHPREKLIQIETNLSESIGGDGKIDTDIFHDDELKNAEVKSLSLKNSLDDCFDELCVVLGERAELLVQLKKVYDTAKLSTMLNGHKYLSEAKVELYESNRKNLSALKKYVRRTSPEIYKHIFSEKKDKLCNFAAYSEGK